jgi:hypothetical protein
MQEAGTAGSNAGWIKPKAGNRRFKRRAAMLRK